MVDVPAWSKITGSSQRVTMAIMGDHPVLAWPACQIQSKCCRPVKAVFDVFQYYYPVSMANQEGTFD